MYGSKSDWFGVHTGVRQGCVIAPLLFNVFVDYLARVAMHNIPFGFKIGYMIHDQLVWPRTARGVSEMLLQFFLYADDMVLLSDSRSCLCYICLWLWRKLCTRHNFLQSNLGLAHHC